MALATIKVHDLSLACEVGQTALKAFRQLSKDFFDYFGLMFFFSIWIGTM